MRYTLGTAQIASYAIFFFYFCGTGGNAMAETSREYAARELPACKALPKSERKQCLERVEAREKLMRAKEGRTPIPENTAPKDVRKKK